MTLDKTCWNCKDRELDGSLPPCSDCKDLLHDFTTYTNWKPRDKEDFIPEWMKE